MRPIYSKESVLESSIRIRDILDSSEYPLTRKEIKQRYEQTYRYTDRAYDKAMVELSNNNRCTVKDLLEEYPQARIPSEINPGTGIYFTGKNQIENWVDGNRRIGLKK